MQHFKFILFFLLSTNAYAGNDTYQIERLDWNQDFNEDTVIHVKNLHGNIHIKRTFDNNFSLHAVAQNHKNRTHKAKYIINDKKENHLSISLVFPDVAPVDKERIDVALIIPATVSLKATINKGQLSAKKLSSSLKVISDEALINISTSANFDIFSKHGDVSVTLMDKTNAIKSKIQTHDGDIIIRYGSKHQPYYEITNGNHVVSNSSQLLNSKKVIDRIKKFNNPQSPIKITLKSDTGRIILIDKHIK
jgi:hypothetical protein